MGEIYIIWFDRLVPVAAAILAEGVDDNAGDIGAEDIVQNVFVELCQRSVKIKDEERYLMRAVTSRAIDERRRRERGAKTFTDIGLKVI